MALKGKADAMLCPPASLIAQMRWRTKDSPLIIGGQDCHPRASARTPATFPPRCLKTPARRAVIVGHSERRTDHGESDALVRAKAEAARRAGLTAIVCIGETEKQRDAGETLAVVVAAACRLGSGRRRRAIS